MSGIDSHDSNSAEFEKQELTSPCQEQLNNPDESGTISFQDTSKTIPSVIVEQLDVFDHDQNRCPTLTESSEQLTLPALVEIDKLLPTLEAKSVSETSVCLTSKPPSAKSVSSLEDSKVTLDANNASIVIPGKEDAATPRSAVIKLWVVAVVTLVLCVSLMISAHLTHSLTLRVEAYHSLYNVGALAGSLLSIKLCRQPQSLQVTFGWARVDVVSYLSSLIFLSSLCFSVVVEAIQTAAHVQHQDPMHHTEATILVCLAALAVNALVFALIGGYTQHQGSFLEVRRSGEVFVRQQVHQDSLQKGLKTLSARNYKAKTSCPDTETLRQGYRDILRDIAGLILAMLCAFVVLMCEDNLISFYIDPALAVISVGILIWLSYPFGAECGNILLQTIPGHVDVASLPDRLQENFPGIVDVHHLHVWSLRPGTVVATVHVVFANKGEYTSSDQSMQNFFQKEGISLVTLQPEFVLKNSTVNFKCQCSDHVWDGNGDACDEDAMHHSDHLDMHHHSRDHHHDHNHDHLHDHNHDHPDHNHDHNDHNHDHHNHDHHDHNQDHHNHDHQDHNHHNQNHHDYNHDHNNHDHHDHNHHNHDHHNHNDHNNHSNEHDISHQKQHLNIDKNNKIVSEGLARLNNDQSPENLLYPKDEGLHPPINSLKLLLSETVVHNELRGTPDAEMKSEETISLISNHPSYVMETIKSKNESDLDDNETLHLHSCHQKEVIFNKDDECGRKNDLMVLTATNYKHCMFSDSSDQVNDTAHTDSGKTYESEKLNKEIKHSTSQPELKISSTPSKLLHQMTKGLYKGDNVFEVNSTYENEYIASYSVQRFNLREARSEANLLMGSEDDLKKKDVVQIESCNLLCENSVLLDNNIS